MYIGFILKIYCVCVSAQQNQNEFCLFLCLCMNLLYKRMHWLSFLYPASVLLLKYTCHLNNALVLKSSSRLICAGNFGLLCSSVEREADNAQIACDCWPFGYFLLSYINNRPANQSRWLSWPSWVGWWCTVTLCMIERMNLSHLIKTRINNWDDWLFTDFN